ncbi:MAG TPA: DUF2784 domain-containing protein, partial [Blastocatellia bacterium]|nr:DUF2784 domain-containing protein [Blastocatellia bacterium]
MLYRIGADLVVAVHLAFVLFVVLGGVFVLKWKRSAWVHIPAALWGVVIEFAGWVCPLTPLENWLREKGGAHGYSGSFRTSSITASDEFKESMQRRTFIAYYSPTCASDFFCTASCGTCPVS